MGVSKMIAAFALTTALVLDQASNAVACTCAAGTYTPCEYIQGVLGPPPRTVLRAVVYSKSVPAGTNDDISVTAEVVGVYSGSDVDNVTFVTGGNSAVCGADLTVGEEYVLGLYVAEPLDSTDEKDLLTVGACGLARLWSDLSADEKDELIFGC